jgi:hypothetical protein
VAVRKIGIALLQISAVGQKDSAEIARGIRAKDRPAESISNQQGQIARMVNMGVCEEHQIDACRVDRQIRPVAQAQLLVSLEQSAIDENATTIEVEEIF